jgi:hypothetical protein
MVRWLSTFLPAAFLGKKFAMTMVLAAIGGAAFYLGRLAGPQAADAQQPGGPNLLDRGAPISESDYGRRIVAQIYGNVPITREELGEFLIARFGAERLEFLVNRRIVEKVCQAYNITVTDAEIAAQLKQDLRTYGGPGMTEKMFVDQILRKFNKSLYEWKEDVIKPKLMLTKYCRDKGVEVTEQDLRNAYESRFGPKVQCRLIVLGKDDPHRFQIWEQVRDNEAKFK